MPDRKAVDKVCIQQAYPEIQTGCFKNAGGKPCRAPDCKVFKAIKILHAMTGEKVTLPEVAYLLHSECRQSIYSKDNEEFMNNLWAVVENENSQLIQP